MNNLEKNKRIIESLKSNPELFNELTITGNILVFRNLTINLNNVDLELIMKDMPDITPDSLFNALSNIKTNANNIANWEIVKQENPDMKRITIFNNHNLNLDNQEEFINIRTSDGQNHLFKNVTGLDIFNEYMKLKAIYGDKISPEILAREIEKWQLNELSVEPAEKIIANPGVNENIKNQIQYYVTLYKDYRNIEITANVAEDIIYINDKSNPENSYIVTFTIDINNNLEAVTHKNNVSSETTIKEENPESQIQGEQTQQKLAQSNIISPSIDRESNLPYQNTQTIISDKDFEYLITKGNWSQEEYKSIINYLANIEEMIKQNDPNIVEKKKIIEGVITNLRLSTRPLTPEEEEIAKRADDLCEEINKSMGLDKGNVLKFTSTKIQPDDEYLKAGHLNIVAIFVTVSAVLIGLSILVLYLING